MIYNLKNSKLFALDLTKPMDRNANVRVSNHALGAYFKP